MPSLLSDRKESSYSTSSSHIATPSALSELEEFDEILERIGRSAFISTRRSTTSDTICESSEHSNDENCTFFIGEGFDSFPVVENPISVTPLPGENIQRVHRDDFHIVCKIGRGGYSDVHMVLDHNRQKRALKALSLSRIKNSDEFVIAAIDLAMEAKILSELNHENIIQLKGISSSRFSRSYTEITDEGFFLVFDLLNDVLNERLTRWRKSERQLSALENKWTFTGIQKVNTKRMHERMTNVALGIVKGMMYLHEREIVMRDLKPANVGFDEEGNVRLFDFGMARRLEDCDPNEICGSPRYMPPEIMAGNGYSFGADVYSFGVILYEICALKLAFDGILNNCRDLREFNRLVIEENLRPKLKKISCPSTKKLIEDCWHGDPAQRPSFEEIYQRILGIVACNPAAPPQQCTE